MHRLSRCSSAVVAMGRRKIFDMGFTSSGVCISSGGNEEKNDRRTSSLDLEEVQKILADVRADDVRIIPSPSSSSWTDFMVVATGRSPWHVRNIAQALIHRVKEKQKGARQLLLPRVQGYEGGKWVVVDSGNHDCGGKRERFHSCCPGTNPGMFSIGCPASYVKITDFDSTSIHCMTNLSLHSLPLIWRGIYLFTVELQRWNLLINNSLR